MRQKATVDRLLADHMAEVLVVRDSACSGDCPTCAGCGSVTQTLRVTAENQISAQRGEVVYLEGDTAVVLKGAALVYLVPLVTFLVAYFAAMSLGSWAILIGFAAFALGMIPAFVYNRKMKNPRYTIVGYVK